MKMLLNAASAAIAVGLLAVTPAKADWRNNMNAEGFYRQVNEITRPVAVERAAYVVPQQQAVTGKKKSAKAGNKGNGLVQKASLTSGGWANAVGSGQTGIASYYWQPQRVASGGWFNPNAMTAAHKTLPFGTKVQVTNLNNGQSVTVTINDRGPYVAGRIIDLSSAAAGAIGMKGAGLARVSVNVLGK